jgi:hypothetical protein
LKTFGNAVISGGKKEKARELSLWLFWFSRSFAKDSRGLFFGDEGQQPDEPCSEDRLPDNALIQR